jgi:hypothetical protein
MSNPDPLSFRLIVVRRQALNSTIVFQQHRPISRLQVKSVTSTIIRSTGLRKMEPSLRQLGLRRFGKRLPDQAIAIIHTLKILA